jgi:CelD/BcsL family acetyltransferase involved in cellulose biosynthesis
MIDLITTREIDPLSDPRWDAYVRAHPDGTVYHLGAWARILECSYGFKPRYLAISQGDSLAGVLPLFRKKGLVSDARMRSIPVFSYGGPLADDDSLTTRLIEAARDLDGVASLTINTDVRRIEPPAGFVVDELLPRWMVEVPADLDALRASWRKTSSNLFRSLKKADRSGLEFRSAASPRDLRGFHRMYVRTMKKHRSLPRSLRQLRLAQELLGDAFKLFVVSHEGHDVAGGVYHVFGDTVELVYNGSDEDALSMRPNHALYWNVMWWAAERGLRQVNLGGAEHDTPLAAFKQQWGATPHTRFRLTHRAGGQPTRTDALTAVGYGAEGSENRLTLAAWRLLPPPLLRLGAFVAYRYA